MVSEGKGRKKEGKKRKKKIDRRKWKCESSNVHMRCPTCFPDTSEHSLPFHGTGPVLQGVYAVA